MYQSLELRVRSAPSKLLGMGVGQRMEKVVSQQKISVLSLRWRNGSQAGKNTQSGIGILGPKSISLSGLRAGKALQEGHTRDYGPAKFPDAPGQAQRFFITVFGHRSKVKGSGGGHGHPGRSVPRQGGAPDRLGVAAGGCEGALAAVPGRGPSLGVLCGQQEQEWGESPLFCSLTLHMLQIFMVILWGGSYVCLQMR